MIAPEKIHADHVRQQETVSENAMDNISDTLNLALVSFSPVWEDIAGNLSRLDGIAGRIFSSGETGGTDILVFPETFATGFSMTPEITQEYGGSGIVGWMKDTARMYGCAVAGSVYVSDGSSGRPVRYNRFCFALPSGDVFSYDKRHLYFGQESGSCTVGESRRLFEWKGWKIMPGVCFDLRFPCWSRNSPASPYDLYLNVANWPSSRGKAADILLKARAIENAAYAAMCNRGGSDPLLDYDGKSRIVNYRGRDKGSVAEICGVPVTFASLAKPELERYRKAFPVLEHID